MEEKNELSLVLQSNISPAILQFNYDQIEEELNRKLKDYTGLVVTEDTLAGCKHAKAELASFRNQLESFRKEKKKEAEKPIKDFDAKCKRLTELITQVESPLNTSIDVFDEKKREEKRQYAAEYIKNTIDKFELRSPFAEKIILKSEYGNLNATKKSVREDIEAQATAIKMEQDGFDKDITLIKNNVSNENERINIKLKADNFISMYESGMDIVTVLNKIKEQAADIFEQEENKRKEEAKKQEENIAIDCTPLFMPQNPADNIPMEAASEPTPESNSVSNTFSTENANIIIPNQFLDTNDNIGQPIIQMPVEKQYEITFKVSGGFSTLRALKEYINASGIKMEVISQIVLNQAI